MVCVDLDGTLLTDSWPKLGDWMPGAIQAMMAFHEAGCRIIVHTSRLNPFDMVTGHPKPAWAVATEIQHINFMLEIAGLTFVELWTKTGKPGADVYIDNKGERYNGKKKSWEKMVERVLMRFDKEAELVDD